MYIPTLKNEFLKNIFAVYKLNIGYVIICKFLSTFSLKGDGPSI